MPAVELSSHAQRGIHPSPSASGIGPAPGGVLSPCPAVDTPESLRVGDRAGPRQSSLPILSARSPEFLQVGDRDGTWLGIPHPCPARGTPESLLAPDRHGPRLCNLNPCPALVAPEPLTSHGGGDRDGPWREVQDPGPT